MKKNLNFSIIIPIYNESDNIIKLFNELKENLKNYYDFEIIFVNDGSTDNSQTILNNLNKNNNFRLTIIINKKNLGQSYSIYKGAQKSQFDNLITIDGDGQNDPKDINKLIKIYFKDSDIILVGGIREKRKDTISKKLSSIIANKVRSFILKDNCKDTGCSLKIFEKKIFLSFAYFDGIHRFLPALFNSKNKKIVFVNVNHRHRVFGKSKYNNINRLIKGINDLVKVYKIINKK